MNQSPFFPSLPRFKSFPQPKSKSLPLALGLLLLTTACQPPTPNSSGPEPEGLKIGTLLPITGDLAQYGAPMQDTAVLLVDQVNRCDGVRERSVQLITEDSQTEPSRGVAAMTKLAEVNQVGGVVGGAASAISTAAIDVAVRNQVVQISPASTSPVFTSRAQNGDFNGFWFRTAPSDALQGPALAQLAHDRGFSSIAVLAINNDYGNGLAAALIPAFEALGGTVSNGGKAIFYPPDAATFDAEVAAAYRGRPDGGQPDGQADGQPDAVVLIAYPETGSLVLRAAFEQGYLDGATQLLLTEGMKAEQIAELVGKNSQGEFIVAGALGTAPQPGGPALTDFLETYNNAYNTTPEIFDANTWDAVALLVLAAESSGEFTGSALKDHISKVANAPGIEVSNVCQALALLREGQEINYQGASSKIELDQWGDVRGNYAIWQVKDTGVIEIIDTIEVGAQL